MSKKKVYAVKKGKVTGLFDSWSECEAAVSGFPGAEYKGFSTEEEARGYLEGRTLEKKSLDSGTWECQTSECQEVNGMMLPATEFPKEGIIAYIDGSFDEKIGRYAFGCIMLTPDGRIVREFGNGDNPESLAIRNVAGEMLGAMFAVKWAAVNGYRAIELRYDYEGIEKWATGVWSAKNNLTQKYAAYMRENRAILNISFRKVKAHAGDYYNDEVDKLAKSALTQGNGIPKIERCSG